MRLLTQHIILYTDHDSANNTVFQTLHNSVACDDILEQDRQCMHNKPLWSVPGYPHSLIPFHLKTVLLWQFNVTINNQTYLGLHANGPTLLPDLTHFHKSPQHQISQKYIQVTTLIHVDRQMDGQT
jgi:hypothetical protein